jgi:hypothetical protein
MPLVFTSDLIDQVRYVSGFRVNQMTLNFGVLHHALL